MRFFLFPFTLISFLALGSTHFPINKDSGIAPAIDTTKGVIVHTYGKKGNGILDSSGKNGYNDPAGENFAYVIYWSRVINNTDTALELGVNFPADSFAVPTPLSGAGETPGAHVKLFLPPGEMTLEKEPLFDYGLTGLKSFLDTNFNKPTALRKTINPKEEYLFYVVVISKGYNGTSRAELVLKDQNLFYRLNMLDSLIPCGQIVLKK